MGVDEIIASVLKAFLIRARSLVNVAGVSSALYTVMNTDVTYANARDMMRIDMVGPIIVYSIRTLNVPIPNMWQCVFCFLLVVLVKLVYFFYVSCRIQSRLFA